ncbi:MAG: coproporphyrinogen dehydrogenase HemZ [Firmicutes bacterium]|nr:coproporphyrinogen dehydrogenase HemZ [Bacillota bacterium]
MYNFVIKNVSNKYDCEELIKVFIPAESFKAWTEEEWSALTDEERAAFKCAEQVVFNENLSNDKNSVKREISRYMSNLTGMHPAWGILTGVRPVKLTGEIFDRLENEDAVRTELAETYLLSEEKTDLLIDTYNYQQEICGRPDSESVGIYIGIPFCPTRCLYCSFTSNQVGDSEIARYLEALKKEIVFVGRRMKETGLWPESIYIGGGTPTTLTAEQLDDLLGCVRENIDLTGCREFTVEAGRPDTITYEKLEAIKKHGIGRISINPQSMKERTLELIGRSHKPGDIVQAFQKADWVGIPMVNADLIAGLPEEEPEDFAETMDRILALDPKNITVHTLAVKRASRLIDLDKDFHFKQAERVKKMLEISKEKLKNAGFRPYYLYRQKNMAGSFENVGYCKEGTPCIYNIRIMEEKQTIIALGAGGISKMYYPEENRLERVPNVSNYEIYISRLEEMLERKEKNIFLEVN